MQLVPKPTLQTFITSTGWQISRSLLKRIGSARHELRVITPPGRPFSELDYMGSETLSPAFHRIHRRLDFRRIGILCCSNTTPAVREIGLAIEIGIKSPIFFGPYDGETSNAANPTSIGKARHQRIDYTGLFNDHSQESQLPLLTPGQVIYPFRDQIHGTHLPSLREKYYSVSAPSLHEHFDLDKSDIDLVERAYRTLAKHIQLSLVIVLDSNELLAFGLDPTDLEFTEDFYSLGVRAA